MIKGYKQDDSNDNSNLLTFILDTKWQVRLTRGGAAQLSSASGRLGSDGPGQSGRRAPMMPPLVGNPS